MNQGIIEHQLERIQLDFVEVMRAFNYGNLGDMDIKIYSLMQSAETLLQIREKQGISLKETRQTEQYIQGIEEGKKVESKCIRVALERIVPIMVFGHSDETFINRDETLAILEGHRSLRYRNPQ